MLSNKIADHADELTHGAVTPLGPRPVRPQGEIAHKSPSRAMQLRLSQSTDIPENVGTFSGAVRFAIIFGSCSVFWIAVSKLIL